MIFISLYLGFFWSAERRYLPLFIAYLDFSPQAHSPLTQNSELWSNGLAIEYEKQD